MTAGDVLNAMRALPFRGLDAILGPRAALILAPHPDDESLGCGGLIAAACAARRPPFVLFLTDGTGSHPHSALYPPARLRAVRENEARDALAILGLPADRVAFLGLPDRRAPHQGAAFDAAVEAIVMRAGMLDCTAIAAPWQHDPHGDHLAAHRMATIAASALDVRQIAYPVWGWTLPRDAPLDFDVRGGRLDIGPYLPAKRRAIAAHVSQHGGLITDDASGFTLPANLMQAFDVPHEVFLDVR